MAWLPLIAAVAMLLCFYLCTLGRQMLALDEYSQLDVVDEQLEGVRYDEVSDKKGVELDVYQCPRVRVKGGREALQGGSRQRLRRGSVAVGAVSAFQAAGAERSARESARASAAAAADCSARESARASTACGAMEQLGQLGQCGIEAIGQLGQWGNNTAPRASAQEGSSPEAGAAVAAPAIRRESTPPKRRVSYSIV